MPPKPWRGRLQSRLIEWVDRPYLARGEFRISQSEKRYQVVDFNQVPGVPCPCGTARRAFADVADFPGTIHRTQITGDAKPHYHHRLTETYYVLQSDPHAGLQLDDEFIPVKPGLCVLIPPGVVHHGVGRMTVLIVVFPKFDPTDEVLVEE